MTDTQLVARLDQLVELANELDAEAKRRHGPQGFLFYEADSGFHIMAGDSDRSVAGRQRFIRFSSIRRCKLGAGAW